jgi:hypothetical protein
VEILVAAHAATTRDDDLGGGEFRTLGPGQLAADEPALGQFGAGSEILDAGLALLASRFESRRTHADDLDRVGRLDGGDDVAGIDRALESVGGDDGDDLGDLRHVEQGGDAWHEVLAAGGRSSQQVRIGRGLATTSAARFSGDCSA